MINYNSMKWILFALFFKSLTSSYSLELADDLIYITNILNLTNKQNDSSSFAVMFLDDIKSTNQSLMTSVLSIDLIEKISLCKYFYLFFFGFIFKI